MIPPKFLNFSNILLVYMLVFRELYMILYIKFLIQYVDIKYVEFFWT